MWIWRICKTAQSLFPNLQENKPENNTVMYSIRRRYILFHPSISNVSQLNLFFIPKKHLCNESWVGFKYSQNRLLLELVHYLYQVLILIMLHILAESFPGARGTCLFQQPLLQIALPNRSGCCAACLSCHTYLLAAPPVAMSGTLSWLQHFPHSNFSFWPIWLDSPLYWPQVKFNEGKGEEGPEMGEAMFLCGAFAGLYSQVCNTQLRIAKCLTGCSICTLQFSCCFHLALLWVKESLQVWKSCQNGCAFIAKWVAAGQL